MKLAANLLLVATLFGASTAAAASRLVALFPVEGDAQLGSRLSAELVSQGFELAKVEAANRDDSFEALLAATRAAGAVLAVRIVVEPSVIRLWIVNTSTGKQAYREAPATAGTPTDSAIVSLWAVEALRASELPSTPAPSPQAEQPQLPSEPPPSRYALQLAPALALSPGGVGASAHVALGGRLLLARRLGVELSLVSPTLPTRLEHATGSARVWRGLATAGLCLTTGAHAQAALDVAVGASLHVTRVSGAGKGGFVGRSEQLVSLGPYARVGGSVALSRRWRLRADVASGVALPRPVVFFVEERVAAWGRPWFLFSVGGEVWF